MFMEIQNKFIKYTKELKCYYVYWLKLNNFFIFLQLQFIRVTVVNNS